MPFSRRKLVRSPPSVLRCLLMVARVEELVRVELWRALLIDATVALSTRLSDTAASGRPFADACTYFHAASIPEISHSFPAGG
jgi:hypothetical protein